MNNENAKLILEMSVYHVADKMIKDYDGGQWKWYGGIACGYWGMKKETVFLNPVESDYFEGAEVSGKFAGACLTVLVCNMRAWAASESGNHDLAVYWSQRYYATRDLVLDTFSEKEGATLLRFLD
jgi:cyanophycinase-like exopeptidase